jgi:predicted RND superfamily exporter protein
METVTYLQDTQDLKIFKEEVLKKLKELEERISKLEAGEK